LSKALPPCEAPVHEVVSSLSATLDEIRPGLRALIPDLKPEKPGAWYATDSGTWYGVGVRGRSHCALEDGTVIITRRGQGMPGTGAAVWFGQEQVLVVGTHDEARDGWDRIGWQAIVAHEWAHLHHGELAERAFFAYRQQPLQRRFLEEEPFQKAVVTLVKASLAQRPACDDPKALVNAWDQLKAMSKPGQHQDASAWMFTEGLARYMEAGWEASARSVSVDELRLEQCTSVDDGDYGYAAGCSVAMALDACLGPQWLASAWLGGFEPAIDQLR
jgi:hypothetical protein